PAGGIPDDWDPFAPDPVAPPKAQDLSRTLGATNSLGLELGGAAAAPLIPGMGDLGGGKANTASSIDAMFGLGSAGGDPLANSVLAPAAIAPNMANHVDPLRSLNTVTAASATAAPDNVSALNQPFMEAPMAAPKVATPAAPAAAMPSAGVKAPPVVGGSAGTRGAVLSWDSGAEDSRTVIRSKGNGSGMHPAVPVTPPSGAPSLGDFDSFGTTAPVAGAHDPLGLADLGIGVTPAASIPAQAPARAAVPPSVPPVTAPVVAPTVAPAAAPAVGAAVPTDQAALIAALREGLGMPALPVQSLTPEFMKLLGQLVHEATRGTVELLVARAALKREIRAEMTMIVAKENNPLKFSPSVEVALNHLLSPPARGFMPPAPAMRDAYDDLRAHQFAFVAGMRAALEGVLKRFDPAVLEGKLTQKSVLATLLPSSRKAKMWDVFTELYGHIS
ncbi:MAG TPA: type VI secretion system-associated FHA domain protein TagH, partial [Aquabacterium sp.]|nr:type VI secretion system-associated FHA domain protein TagH [Aquabacterium sp.]